MKNLRGRKTGSGMVSSVLAGYCGGQNKHLPVPCDRHWIGGRCRCSWSVRSSADCEVVYAKRHVHANRARRWHWGRTRRHNDVAAKSVEVGADLIQCESVRSQTSLRVNHLVIDIRVDFTVRRGRTVLGDGAPRDCPDHAPRGYRNALGCRICEPGETVAVAVVRIASDVPDEPRFLWGRVDPGIRHAHAETDAVGDPYALRQGQLAGRVEVNRAEQPGPVSKSRALEVGEVRPDIAPLITERVAGDVAPDCRVIVDDLLIVIDERFTDLAGDVRQEMGMVSDHATPELGIHECLGKPIGARGWN